MSLRSRGKSFHFLFAVCATLFNSLELVFNLYVVILNFRAFVLYSAAVVCHFIIIIVITMKCLHLAADKTRTVKVLP